MANQALTSFGVMLRKHRLDRGETLFDMASAIDVSSSFLSAVETGQKRAPEELVQNLIAHLKLDWVDQANFREAAAQTGPELRIPLRGKSKDARDVAAMFARRFQNGDIAALKEALARLEDREGNK
jgi:HTH-type transcriptional regulator, competence development regulator